MYQLLKHRKCFASRQIIAFSSLFFLHCDSEKVPFFFNLCGKSRCFYKCSVFILINQRNIRIASSFIYHFPISFLEDSVLFPHSVRFEEFNWKNIQQSWMISGMIVLVYNYFIQK